MLRRLLIRDAMPDIGLAEKARRGEIGRAGPDLDRIRTALQAHDELVVRNLRLGAAVSDLLIVDRKARLLHGPLIGLFVLARVVINDLHINAAIKRSESADR